LMDGRRGVFINCLKINIRKIIITLLE